MISVLKEVIEAVEQGNEAPTIDILDTIYLALEPNYYDVKTI
jgi:hypothetical protein